VFASAVFGTFGAVELATFEFLVGTVVVVLAALCLCLVVGLRRSPVSEGNSESCSKSPEENEIAL
jgi:hypothetical protein